jgi:two-component system chemotaxis response regulator CheY
MPRILDVGQCGFDHGSIRRTLGALPGTAVEHAATHDDALLRLAREAFDLVLVNRIGDADGRPGIDLVRAIRADDRHRETPIMLVSNLPAAQAEAVAAGALPGFGKSELGAPQVFERVLAALGSGPSAGDPAP